MAKTGKTKKSKQENGAGGNGIAALTAQLWQAAVNLRGSIEPADYKRYVLPIIFLRFLSLRYERRRAELERLIADPASEHYTTKPAVARDILEDPDEYRRAGAFIVPENARWANIRTHAQSDDVKVRLDDILEQLENTYPDKLKGLLPRIYAGSNLDRENVTSLINLFSKDIFEQDHGGEDLIGRVYEYFIGEFASSEGKRGGEYFTPRSIVRTLVAMLEPERGVVLDPCCGSGGMFVQADEFTRHSHELSFIGQESKDFTYRLCRMNLFIHGLDGKIELGNSYFNDLLANVKADYVIANPPFNDGSKGEDGWGADRVPAKDPRLQLGERRATLSPRNANTMWILHFLYHLKDTGVTSNEGGNGSGATATLNVGSNAPSPSITTTSLPSGVIGQSYSALILATGGAGNYTFSATGLPAGLTISASGQISGTPTRPGTFTFTAEATDQNSATASATFTIIISASTLSFSATFPVGIVGIDYPLQILTATGGVAPYTFAIKSGSGTLPPGLTFSGPQFSGIPTTAGYYAFTIVVTDSAGNSVSTPATITINPAHADLVISQSSVSFTLTVGSGGLPTPASDTVGSSDVTQLLNYSVAESPVVSWLDINGGGTTPGSVGLVLDPSALTLGAGTYQTTVNVACNAPSPCAGKMHPIQVTLTVNAQAPQLSATSQLVSFQTVASNTATLSQPLGIENSGGGTLAISSITPGASWITVSGAPSILQAGKPVSITVTANPAGLSPNYYSSSIAINSSAGSLTAPVTLEIAPNLTMSLAPGGTQFSAPAGSFPGNSAGSFLVTAAGNGTVSWNASVTAGANFLNLSTTTGTSTAASPGSVSFSLNSAAVAGLAVGAYYGTIHVTSGSVADSPLDFGVVLNITSVNATVRPNPSPAGLIFTSSTGPSQSVLVFASSSAELSYQASAETPAGQTWLSVSPGTGTASSASPGQSTVTVNPASLTPGMYRGSVSYAFSSAVVSTVNVTMTITGSGTVTSSIAPAPRASGCTPANLVPTQTGLISNFQQPAGWPVPLTVTLIDDCGTAVTNGQVIATFSNGDPPLTLAAIDASSGIYTGTWTPSGVAPQATITSTATAGTFPSASTRITGEVSANTPPLLNPNGVLHVFNPAIGGALAPGTILQIYGSNLAAQAVTAQAIPLPTSPGGTSVLIGGVAVPLYYVSPGQINAELPFEAVPGSQLQVQVNANGALSTPGTIQVTQAEPGIATLASGQAIAQHADYSLVSAASPAKPGEILMIYLAGLGATDNAVATGAAAPLSPLSRALIPPTVTVNGVNATVSFAGLTPTTVGLYQIDFQVPATTQNGQAGVVVSQSGVTSNTAILPVQQ